MAQRKIEYFYSTHSAYAYLGSRRLAEICAAHDCQLIHRPFLLSPVVEQAGGRPFAGRSQAHVDYFFGREIERWAAYRGVPIITYRPTYHDNALTLSSGMVIMAERLGQDVDALAHALLEAHWRDDIDLMNPEQLSQAARNAGLDPEPLLAGAMAPDVQAVLQANTDAALRMHLFGSPTYVLDGDPYYGQDHLELLEFGLRQPFPDTTFQNPPVGAA
ncbi:MULTISPECIES: 2-hydroxychromene-2-carboxylate isomerase [Rhodobacterales]|jgi:2-hydroxychromene-2-carboxylate isomerase|uniref:2-hydroxychromene-2-carboxylate isomerase n=1 Tax=Rhodobacterales TaxID=204455 RepID=UPI00237F2FE6|nr:2-hydroxychromene-2-carboxylate isomerase [Phaeobacter gallaeciensis]MDE4095882.1 2-hydroxychromene-2-carboxylate isomerase [Phaeobacter gallaeciensis]MDE4104693.1 2-hydroxychromene-2-carboxylate isomerase [Phaeobacter gallaeciensis]MDE4109150.1 2-hydroxychromene-2-carboxylate isomerase [Phaeobacter gallaeciensis]MDE4113617.1 2-hydroxychromene-2-carboxylate isomerase [Phaeobacter gallaeciensis]MDE4118085.1 2-hydroxychromene-2-carboxylate isomerase [Phaeobacter gallaeciensis]